MSFKLTKQDEARRAEILIKLAAAREALDAKIEDVNDAVDTARDALEDEVRAYNEALEEARGFAVDIAAQAEEDFGDKSERWQEGERGEIAREWITEWEGVTLDDIELPQVERVAIEADDHAEALEALPSEAEF